MVVTHRDAPGDREHSRGKSSTMMAEAASRAVNAGPWKPIPGTEKAPVPITSRRFGALAHAPASGSVQTQYALDTSAGILYTSRTPPISG